MHASTLMDGFSFKSKLGKVDDEMITFAFLTNNK